MPVRYGDADIRKMLDEVKTLPADYGARLLPKAVKRGQLERELELRGEGGTRFTIIVRQTVVNPLRFSVILACPAPGLTNRFLIRRYNGDHGMHTNRLEGTKVRGTHIHIATERYQAAGYDEEAFALEDSRFVDLQGAIETLIADCSMVTIGPKQLLMNFGDN